MNKNWLVTIEGRTDGDFEPFRDVGLDETIVEGIYFETFCCGDGVDWWKGFWPGDFCDLGFYLFGG
jgi:hypothetical protein